MSYKTEATKKRLAKLLEIQKQYEQFLDSLNLLIRYESFRLGNNLYDDENKKKGGR